jgi:predicted AlkP superfamily pyrophosphatase or phosphodiesterase
MASAPRGQYIHLDRLMNPDHVRVVSYGVLAGFVPKSGYKTEVETRLLKPHPHMTCWRKQDIPARLHYGTNARIPPINCLSDVGWQITTSDHLAHLKYPMSLGEHGYDNASPLMRALFIAHGPSFRRGVVAPSFPNVDVYPLMTHLLGIKGKSGDGHYKAVKDMLRSGR